MRTGFLYRYLFKARQDYRRTGYALYFTGTCPKLTHNITLGDSRDCVHLSRKRMVCPTRIGNPKCCRSAELRCSCGAGGASEGLLVSFRFSSPSPAISTSFQYQVCLFHHCFFYRYSTQAITPGVGSSSFGWHASTEQKTPSAKAAEFRAGHLQSRCRLSHVRQYSYPVIMTESSIYASFPVKSSLREIRLLILHPGAWDAPVRCSLAVESLNNHPEYDTLSYSWGQDTTPATILVENRPLTIRKTLYNILQRLRRGVGGKDMALWIDAICINQIDDHQGKEEKAGQIGMMVWVYWHCRQVLVWLGNCYTDRAQAIRFLTRTSMEHMLQEYRQDFNRDPNELDYCFHLGCFFFLLHDAGKNVNFATYGLPPFWAQSGSRRLRRCKIPATSDEFKTHYAARLYYVLRFVSETEWPTRVWTLQEYAVAPKAIFCFGTTAVPQNVLSNIKFASQIFPEGRENHEFWSARLSLSLQSIRQNFYSHTMLRNSAARLRPLDTSPLRSRAQSSRLTPSFTKILNILRNLPPISLFEYCATFRQLNATFPMDKVIPITGFMEFLSLDPPNYNYDDQVAEVYIDISARHILSCKNHPELYEPLAPLRFCRDKNKFKLWDLPSWVVDWTSFPRHDSHTDCRRSSPRLQDLPSNVISWLHIETTKGPEVEQNEENPFRFNGATRYDAAKGLVGEPPSILSYNILAISGRALGVVSDVVRLKDSVKSWNLFQTWAARNQERNAWDRPVVISRRTQMLRTLCANGFKYPATVDWPRLVALWPHLLTAFSTAGRLLVQQRQGNSRPGITFAALAKEAASLVGETELANVEAADRAYASELLSSITATCRGNSLFVMDDNNLGVGGSEICVGDEVYVLYQGRTPFVLRRCSASSSQFTVVSECYVDGLMNGEAASMGGGLSRIEIR